MHVYFGADHGGYLLKERLIAVLQEEDVQVTDCGTHSPEMVDFPPYAVAVAEHVAEQPGHFGVLLCRSGEGMEMAANKVRGIRSALVWNEAVAGETRRDNDANVLVLPGDFMSERIAIACLRRFLVTDFSTVPRYKHRLEELSQIEHGTYVPSY